MENDSKDKPFMIIYHRALNNKEPDIRTLENQVNILGRYITGRKPALALHGDLTEYYGILFFAHNYNTKTFDTLRDIGFASHFKETIKYIRENHPETTLYIELKPGITKNGMKQVVNILKENEIHDYMYDSISGKELDLAHDMDYGCMTSYHLMGYFNGIEIPSVPSLAPRHKYTVTTIPYITTIGNPKMPMIYGMVNSLKRLQKAAEKDNVVGAIIRFDDSNIIKIVGKSMSY
jgi:hypothetical protein